MLTNVGRVIAGYVLLVSASIPAIAATISADQAAPWVKLHIEGLNKPGDAKKVAKMALALKPKDAWDLNWLHVYLNSRGGSVRESIRIGLFLRNNNASISVYSNQVCRSSCVFVLISGVMRMTAKETIGIHRPFLQRVDVDQDFEKMYRDTRGELEKYFDKMRVSKGLLDLMYSVPPNEMRILSDAEIQQFLPFEDPVYEEKRTTHSAQGYALTNMEYRRRKAQTDKCYKLLREYGLEGYENCTEAILWGLTITEFIFRKTLMQKICIDESLERAAFKIPKGLNKFDCRIYVMSNGV